MKSPPRSAPAAWARCIARPTRHLKRAVAIKVLPATLASDIERIARFQREAEILASLNHPNIAQVHGLEKSNGTTALVMELVEGPTLADRMAQGPIPFDEALAVARQIAEALGAAHEQGIVHRDLKPANIKIREDGTVKVLDFGLAKAMLPGGSLTADSQSPTITTPAMTKAGFILGTAAYMSPEQARGKAVDKRADIWAFGCVLYEMLTGARAFDAEDCHRHTGARADARTRLAVLLPSDVPRPIRILLDAACRKTSARRLADMSAALLLIDELPALAASTSAGQASVREADRGRRRRDAPWPRCTSCERRVALALGFRTGAGCARGPRRWFRASPTPNVVRTMVTPSGAYSLSLGGFDRDVTITPDGTRIVYRGVDQLLVRALDSLEPIVLPNLNNPQGVFASPDGEWVGFFDGDSALWKVPISGGPAVKLTNTSALFPRGATWIEDGTIVYAHGSSGGLWAVAASGGEPNAADIRRSRQRARASTRSPEALPGGRAVLFTITVGGRGGDTSHRRSPCSICTRGPIRSCSAVGLGHDTWRADTWSTPAARVSSPCLSTRIASW